jgi:hypothetical protein
MGRPGRGSAAALGAAVLAAALTAGPVQAASVTIRGPQVFTSIVLDSDASDAIYCGLSTTGAHHEFTPGKGEALVGYVNFYDPGTEPAPCWEKIDHAYRAQVRFKSGWMDKYRHGPIAGFYHAYLTFGVRGGMRSENGVAYERGLWSAAAWLGVLTSPWSTAGEDGRHRQGDSFTPASFRRKLATGTATGGVRVSPLSFKVNVTSMVLDWVCGRRANHGFALRGPDETFAADQDRYLSAYHRFELRLTGIGSRTHVRRC